MLEGIQIKPLKKKADERGFFMEFMRKDWRELLGEAEIVQANLSISYPGIVISNHLSSRIIKVGSEKWVMCFRSAWSVKFKTHLSLTCIQGSGG